MLSDRPLDCDFSTGECPECGARRAATTRRNCPIKRKRGIPADGPGRELSELLSAIGVSQKNGCPCPYYIAVMNIWGVAGCRANRATIKGWLEEGYDLAGLGEKLRAGALALAKGLPLTLDGLLEEAIRRAEAKEAPPA